MKNRESLIRFHEFPQDVHEKLLDMSFRTDSDTEFLERILEWICNISDSISEECEDDYTNFRYEIDSLENEVESLRRQLRNSEEHWINKNKEQQEEQEEKYRELEVLFL